MISDKGALHASVLAQHVVFKETSSDQIIEFSLVRRVLSLVLDYFIIKIVDIVEYFISQH